jgi:hypothetical protein
MMTPEALAQTIVAHSSLSRLSDDQRDVICCTVIAVETDPENIKRRGRSDYFLDGLCFSAAQEMARHSDGRIGYVEGCLVDLDHIAKCLPPFLGNDPTRAGRWHHGWNLIDGITIDINMILRAPNGHFRHERSQEIPLEALVGDGYSYFDDVYAHEVFGTDEDVELAGASR